MTSIYRPWRLICGVIGIVLLAFAAPGARATEPEASELRDGELVDQFDRRTRVFEGFLRAEVASAVNRARAVMTTQPEQATRTLEFILDKVRRATDVDPSLRSQLVGQIEAAQRLVHHQAELHADRELTTQHAAAMRNTHDRALQANSTVDQTVAQYLGKINALLAEGRYRDAEALASTADESLPGHSVFRNAVLQARMKGNTLDYDTLRTMKAKGLVDVYRQEELASVPTPDQPPILYPDPEAWQLLTNRRQRHAVDVKPRTDNELKIEDALYEKTECDFIDQPLSDVMDYFKQLHGIEIQLDKKALSAAGVDGDMPITRSLKGVTLRSALKLILGELDLTYVIRHEVLLITSKTEADSMQEVRVYPVADLVDQNPFRRRAARRFGIGRMSPAAAAGFGAF